MVVFRVTHTWYARSLAFCPVLEFVSTPLKEGLVQLIFIYSHFCKVLKSRIHRDFPLRISGARKLGIRPGETMESVPRKMAQYTDRHLFCCLVRLSGRAF